MKRIIGGLLRDSDEHSYDTSIVVLYIARKHIVQPCVICVLWAFVNQVCMVLLSLTQVNR